MTDAPDPTSARTSTPTPAPSAAPLLVACLCAAWCGTCREYLPLFTAQAAGAAALARYCWVDIEDHDEVPGDLDIENFPTLLIARGEHILFYGPVLPHATTLARLVDSAAAGDLKPLRDATLEGLPARVAALGAAVEISA